MNFSNLEELIDAVHQHDQFQHEIKGKRIKKQLANLQQYHNDRVTFKRYCISNAGLSFFIEIMHEHRLFDFEVLLDFDYPFNRPKIYYIHDSSPYAFCQDLLDTLLETGNWGPSMLLSYIFDRIYILAKYLYEDNESLKATYHVGDLFSQELLTRYKVELFHVEEYEWKYMLKSTYRRVLGLSKDTLLKFNQQGQSLKLDTWIKIKDIKQANASISQQKFKLDIICNSQNVKSKLYFGGEEQYIEKILYFMNPIQVTERKLSKGEKQSYKNEEIAEMIQQYSQLIEYYSLRDQQKTKKYVNLVQELIKKSYEQGLAPSQQLQEIKEDIKT